MTLKDILNDKDKLIDLVRSKEHSIYWSDYFNFVNSIIDLPKLSSLSEDELIENITDYSNFPSLIGKDTSISEVDALAFGLISGLFRFYNEDGLKIYKLFKQLDFIKIKLLVEYISKMVGSNKEENLSLRDDFKKLIIASVELAKLNTDDNSRLKFKYFLKDNLFIVTENYYKSILVVIAYIFNFNSDIGSLSKKNLSELFNLISGFEFPFKEKILDRKWLTIRNSISHIKSDGESILINWQEGKIKFIDKSNSFECKINDLLISNIFIFNYRQYIHFSLTHLYFCKGSNRLDLLDIDRWS